MMYLSITVFFVFSRMHSILTKCQIILSHPLTGILSSLCSKLHHPGGATKVNLKPLETVVMPRAPGPHSMTSAAEMKPAVAGRMVLVPAGRSSKLVCTYAAILHS